jgi:LuxR family maltose regulon positive regulatory protein
VEAALAAAEPDRLLFPFAATASTQLLDTLPPHETAHRGLLADVVDLLGGSPPAEAGPNRSTPVDDLSPSELRVLRYLPTNLTRPEIAQELYVSVNTVNTHLRSVYSKLGVRDRSGAVRRARELRLLASGGLRAAT